MSDYQDALLQQAETILTDAQRISVSRRITIETRLKSILRAVYPYSLSASEIHKRHDIPLAGKILAYLALFDEVEKEGQGKYRHIPR